MEQLQTIIDRSTLTLKVCGRIDSTNAPRLEAEIAAALAQSGCSEVQLDAESLEYLSSAGLRVLLALRKARRSLRVFNVSPQVYEVFDMTGFTEIMHVEKALRRISVDGCKEIGRGAKSTVYRMDADTIIKVYKDANSLPTIRKERELAKCAFVLGVPTMITYDVVRVGNSYGTVFELLQSKTLSQLVLEDADNRASYIREFAMLLRKIHKVSADTGKVPDAKNTVMQWYEMAKSCLRPSDAEQLRQRITSLPDTGTLLHLDYHTNNVMEQGGELLIIDMDTLSHGHPIIDLANVYLTFVGFGEIDPTVVEKFLGLPYELTKQIWKQFLRDYLETDDEQRLHAVEQKAKLLSDTRFLRHTLRRRGDETAEGRAVIELCAKRIPQLLAEVETLCF